MNYQEYPIIITGCARSGTSLTAGIINLCGAFGGAMRKPNVNNKKGMFENIFITNNIVKPFLRLMYVDPRGQNPLPNPAVVIEKASSIGEEWRKNVLESIQRERYDGSSQWFYKGAKACLIWQVWNSAFPNARWVIVRRKKEDIVKSCLRTSFMIAYNDAEGWGKWVDYHVDRFEEMKRRLNVREIHSEKIVRGDLNEIKSLVSDFGLTYNEDKIRDFISPELWNQERR